MAIGVGDAPSPRRPSRLLRVREVGSACGGPRSATRPAPDPNSRVVTNRTDARYKTENTQCHISFFYIIVDRVRSHSQDGTQLPRPQLAHTYVTSRHAQTHPTRHGHVPTAGAHTSDLRVRPARGSLGCVCPDERVRTQRQAARPWPLARRHAAARRARPARTISAGTRQGGPLSRSTSLLSPRALALYDCGRYSLHGDAIASVLAPVSRSRALPSD